MTTFEEIKAKSRLATKSVPLCLAGDLQAEFEELERERGILREAQKRGGTLSGSSNELKAVEEKVQVLREEMQDATQVFTLRALTKRRYSDLKAAHPPRDEDKEKRLDFNNDTFGVALIQACLIDPALTIPEVEDLVDTTFTQGQWDRLYVDAFLLNESPVSIPT